MESEFPLFGLVHLLILLGVPGFAAALTVLVRIGAASAGSIRIAVAVLLILNTIVWYGHLTLRGWLQFPDTLPLELCDVTLALTVISLLTLNPLSVDLAYYGALAGTTMALLTPDLWETFPSFSTVQFFISHGLVVTAVLFLIWTKQARPRPRSVWRAMAGLNLFAGLIGFLNGILGTNYMYLRAKPQQPSLLDYMGPWPWYLLTGEAVALILFALLWLPFRR